MHRATPRIFLSTPSARRATGRFRLRRFLAEFLSTPSARRATQPRTPYAYERAISIHALCEEGDSGCCTSSSSPTDFYPRPLRGGRLAVSGRAGRPRSISIHALCEEGDRRTRRGAAMTGIFLSTPSARRATALSSLEVSGFSNFYPRPLRGGRPTVTQQPRGTSIFLSTPSARRATEAKPHQRQVPIISIHALCEEGDRGTFSPSEFLRISIHALCEEGDVDVNGFAHILVLFLSTPSARRATFELVPKQGVVRYFYPRPPRGGRQQKQRQNLYFLINYTTFCTNLEEP